MKGLRKLAVLGAFVVAGMVGLGSSSAKADFIPTLISVSGSGGTYTYTYSVQLTLGEGLANAGHNPSSYANGSGQVGPASAAASFFTIYDFEGLIGGTETYTQELGSTVTWGVDDTQTVGYTPTDVTPSDNSNIPNVTFYYMGGTPTIGQDIFTVSIQSHINLVSNGKYTSMAVNLGTGGNNEAVGNVLVPNSQGQLFGPSPAAAWGGLALLALLGVGKGVRKVLA